jgi:biotin carboxyl carrier protein
MRPALRGVEATPAAAAPPPAPEPPTPPPQAPLQEPASSTPSAREFTVEVDGEAYKVRILGDGVMPAMAAAPGKSSSAPAPAPSSSSNGAIQAPMQGMVVKVKVGKGDKVRLGDVVVVLEAMKMQNDIVATVGGTVQEVFAREGAIVAPNEVLMTIA